MNLDRIPTFFTAWIATNGAGGPAGEIAAWLASGGIDAAGYTEIVGRHGAGHEHWFHDSMLDLVLAYARVRLAEGILNLSDVADIRVLRMALHVEDADLYERRPAELSAFLQETYEAILADGYIDEREDLYLVEVQAAFGLSYDQFLMLARPALERAATGLRLGLQLGTASRDDREIVQEKLAALEPTYLLATAHRRSLGALY